LESRAIIVLVLCSLAGPLVVAATVLAAGRLSLPAISFTGVGNLRWGMTLRGVERALGTTFDCYRGAVPGTCLCEQGPGATDIAFSQDRLVALFAVARSAHTSRGVSTGSPARQVRERYPHSRLIRGGLGGGLATFYLARHDGHAIAFSIERGKVVAIEAFASDALPNIGSEFCA
jgi:hypothetical protein